MEDLFHEFKTWMSETEVKVAALSLTANEEEERKQQVEDTQVSDFLPREVIVYQVGRIGTVMELEKSQIENEHYSVHILP